MGHTVRFTLSEGTGDGVCEKLCALRRSLRYFARLLPIPIFCARRDFLVLRLVSDMPRTAHTAPPGNPKHVSMLMEQGVEKVRIYGVEYNLGIGV